MTLQEILDSLDVPYAVRTPFKDQTLFIYLDPEMEEGNAAYHRRTATTNPVIRVGPGSTPDTLAHELQHHLDYDRHFTEGDTADKMAEHHQAEPGTIEYLNQPLEERARMRQLLTLLGGTRLDGGLSGYYDFMDKVPGQKKKRSNLYRFANDGAGETLGVKDLPSDALLKAVQYKPRLIVKRLECYG